MEIKSILIKDTTKEERIHIVQEGLSQCGGACDFCNGCDNLGGGLVDGGRRRVGVGIGGLPRVDHPGVKPPVFLRHA